ncbi:arylsulfatase [Paenibacillus sp. CGMCC 1.16610]|uniref:Sulfatase-like hydrolase/transferase n=1 Tax=Paenibacillus anseongense TaxID=2682845 RepID=A0ABW9U9V7_9BACL|nr:MULTISPECIES: arylsulfatase [Paenibacillus]MBA2937695.1 arylsulfatase [Paenibacillus sp. CGMCC 1.16610]MVQ36753.1 sulfatase-like hydrolase/transferase [Paenibacillus anseongense]
MKSKQPNIIYILADDMGYGDISYLNKNSKIHTVHFDRLAKEGIAFTDAHSSSAVCTPSRYSILTGRYNWRSSLKKGVLNGFSAPLIEDGRMTVASLLREQGYKTACIGKWHLGMEWAKVGDAESEVDYREPVQKGPISHGFDYYYGISASLDMPPYVYIENDRVTQLPDRITRNDDPVAYWREGATAPDFEHQQVLPKLTAKTLEWIEKCKDEPFFIYFPLPAPHTPILPSEAFVGQSGTNAYGDFVLMCDDVIGQIMNKLDELQLSDNTIVIYTSDNGCSPRANYEELAAFGHNPSYVFRGHKADIYEGGHRIPLIVKWPQRIQAGRLSDEPVCLTDLLATVAEIVEVTLPPDAGEDSVSNLPVWADQPYERPLREAIVHHSIQGAFSIRQGNWKLELCPGSGGWSYPKPGEEPEGSPQYQLYDLSTDIGETNNLVDAYPEIVQAMKLVLERYQESGRSVAVSSE